MLLKSITEIKSILPIGIGNDFNRLAPHIANAENKYIKSLLGTATYNKLTEFYSTDYPDNPTDQQKAFKTLLEKIQHSLIHLTYYAGFDFLNTTISDSGFQRTETDNLKGLYKYQEDNLRNYFSDSGFNSLDDVLIYIEENIIHFEEFKNSSNRTELKSSFLPTVKVIESIPFIIHNSRLIFLSLKPHTAYIEDTIIKKILGDTIYAYIKSEMIKDSPDPKVSAILPYIRKPLIYLSSALLMEETGATLGRKGLYFEKINPIFRGNTNKEPSLPYTVSFMVERNRKMGTNYLNGLISYLLDNEEDWPDYTGETTFSFSRNNTDKKTFWA
jgi:hypothetical protein